MRAKHGVSYYLGIEPLEQMDGEVGSGGVLCDVPTIEQTARLK